MERRVSAQPAQSASESQLVACESLLGRINHEQVILSNVWEPVWQLYDEWQ